MNDLLAQIAWCIERGKATREAPYPADLVGVDGAAELTAMALEAAIPVDQILREGLTMGMRNIGARFGRGEVFIPDILIAAQAMRAAMDCLKPYLDKSSSAYRGTLILGTVAGDIHDIGKNIVRLVLEGEGWEVIDLGVDVTTVGFLQALAERPESLVGMSSLLTTTMLVMKESVEEIHRCHPSTSIYVGGAPVTQEFADKIGADGYFAEPYALARYLSESFHNE